jgi:site-specific recombinase XerD
MWLGREGYDVTQAGEFDRKHLLRWNGRHHRKEAVVAAAQLARADLTPGRIVPVEYAVAVDRYLTAARLSAGSRRVYRISLTTWCWPLVGQRPPPGRSRRGAAPPVVPLALLDQADASPRLAAAIADRAAVTDARTVNRELSALRSAVGWWQDQGWISGDPTAGLEHVRLDGPDLPPLTDEQLAALWRSGARLREHALWHLLYDSGATVTAVLALDSGDLDLDASRVKQSASAGRPILWRPETSDLLGWLLAGRRHGPVFLTGRRAPARIAARDICPLTGRARMSYRRAAEIFTGHTSRLDPAGRGWTLHQLRSARARHLRPGAIQVVGHPRVGSGGR